MTMEDIMPGEVHFIFREYWSRLFARIRDSLTPHQRAVLLAIRDARTESEKRDRRPIRPEDEDALSRIVVEELELREELVSAYYRQKGEGLFEILKTLEGVCGETSNLKRPKEVKRFMDAMEREVLP